MSKTTAMTTSMVDGYTYDPVAQTWHTPPAPWESDPMVKAAQKKLTDVRATFDAVDAVWVSAVQRAAEIRLQGVGGPILMAADGSTIYDTRGNSDAKARDFEESELGAAAERREAAWENVVRAQGEVAAEIRRATARSLD